MSSITFPKTTRLPSSQDVLTVVMKNWKPLVPLPGAGHAHRAARPVALQLEVLVLDALAVDAGAGRGWHRRMILVART